MKLLFLRLFMLTAIASTLASCGFSPDATDAGGAAKTRVPWPQKDGSYALEVIELTGLVNLYELSGQFVNFFMSPNITSGHLNGARPKARFLKSGDIYIASDDLSMQLATVYGHMEKLANLDNEVGAAGINKWPRDVGVAVRLSGGVRNNAFYDGDTDSMLFVPYTEKSLPISVNAGILAHEHFHSLFYKLVTVPLKAAGKNPGRISITAHSQEEIYKLFNFPQDHLEIDELPENKAQSSYHILLMRGLNEGLADFWGWLYTGNPDFIAASLPTEKRIRSLNLDATDGVLVLSSSETLRQNVNVLSATDEKNLSKNLNSYAYQIGTQYSRILKAFTDKYARNRDMDSLVARKEVARMILKTLPSFKEDILKLKDTDYYEPSAFLESLLAQAGEVKQNECELIAAVLNSNDLETEKSFACVKKENSDAWLLEKQVVTEEKNPTAEKTPTEQKALLDGPQVKVTP